MEKGYWDTQYSRRESLKIQNGETKEKLVTAFGDLGCTIKLIVLKPLTV